MDNDSASFENVHAFQIVAYENEQKSPPRTWFQIAKKDDCLIEDRLFMINPSATIQWRWVTKIIRNREPCLFLDPWGGSWKIVSWDSNCWSDEPYLLHALLLAHKERDQGPSCYRAALSLIPFVSHTRTGSRSFVTNAIPYPKKWWCLDTLVLGFAKVIEPQRHVSKTSWSSLATSHIVIIIHVPSHHNRCQRDVMLTQEEGAVPCCSCSKQKSHHPSSSESSIGICRVRLLFRCCTNNSKGCGQCARIAISLIVLLSIVMFRRPHYNA